MFVRLSRYQSEMHSFEKNAELCQMGDPWEYTNYLNLVGGCLDTIGKVAQRSFPLKVLIEAHVIQTNPLFYGPNQKVIKRRDETVKMGKDLLSAFERVCKERKQELLPPFCLLWDGFSRRLEEEMAEAEERCQQA